MRTNKNREPLLSHTTSQTPMIEDTFAQYDSRFDSAISTTSRMIYEGTKRFTAEHKKDFFNTSVRALDLCRQDITTQAEVEEYLLKHLEPTTCLSYSGQPIYKQYKTIMLLGPSAEGKSTLVTHLEGKQVAETGQCKEITSAAASFYISEQCGLNIIDTRPINGIGQEDYRDNAMAQIFSETMFHLGDKASIDAFVVMWCPIKNGRSGLSKTVRSLKNFMGNTVLKSCIVMIQGNWRPLEEILQLTKVVNEAVCDFQQEFPDIPIIEYDAKGSLSLQKQTLMNAIIQVQPFRDIEEKMKENYMMAAGNLLIRRRLQEGKWEKEMRQESLKQEDRPDHQPPKDDNSKWVFRGVLTLVGIPLFMKCIQWCVYRTPHDDIELMSIMNIH